MTSFEEPFTMINTYPDERAAGVISGSDPYRELELYLEKVNEEIGEVFDKWNTLSAQPSPPVKLRKCEPCRQYLTLQNEELLARNEDLNFFKSYTLPIRPEGRNFETYLDAWSNSLLAEFNTIIQNEAASDSVDDDDYDEVASDSSDDDDDDSSMRMKYRIVGKRDDFEVSSSPTGSPSTSERSSSGSSAKGNVRRSPPYLSRIGRNKQRSHVASANNKRDPILVNMKMYPNDRPKLAEVRRPDYDYQNSNHNYPAFNYCINELNNRERLAVSEIGTQTSPTESRSSSFTWISDCSEDDHSSTASSTEDSRRLGDSSGNSTPVRDEAESGIGTASPPRHPKYNKEIEAAEACKWLRAAGFPQYAQMFEDKQFPTDISAVSVQKDHPFLDPDTCQSLLRRFQTLNRCANMKVELMPADKEDDSDSDSDCALSEYWSFQPDSRRWSRNRDTPYINPPAAAEENWENYSVFLNNSTLPPFAMQTSENDITLSRFRRSGSERLRDGAKAFLRRVESLKSRRRKQKNREGVVISGPLIVDAPSMEARIKDLNCVDVTPPESPLTIEDSHRRSVRRYLSKPETDFSAFSDSELSIRQSYTMENGNSTKTLLDVSDLSNKQSQCSSRSGSQDSQTFSQSSPSSKKNESTDSITETDASMRPKTTVARWHSFQRNSVRAGSLHGQSINSLTVGQIRVLRKLAMLKLTAIMEKFCPTHRTTGWNWELPKFIRKTKTPDYKDKNVFGVPLLTNVQQTGHALPSYIQEALNWLRVNALDQVGLFRKPGVRSRIHKLKMMAEMKPAKISFDNQQAYDVADMVKQYFRELPDALLTNKLSETFVAIFQYVPDNQRAEAVQRALILLPDEHRDALLILLDFLYQVAQHSYVNQMSANNLAVCLAPSLFYWTHTSANCHIRRSASMSPKRLQKSGTFPDVKELGQNKAAHECLYYLIKHYRDLFVISEEVITQCHFDYMDESVPVSLDELGEELQQDWRGYMNMCRNALQKEVKEKNRGWVISTTWEDVEIAYKKVRDGHPLRLWRVCTDVEAPPKELLYRVLRERHIWDPFLLRTKSVQRLDPHTELFQYVTSGIGPLPEKDFCVIRSWKTDLTKGGCMVVETSVEHNDAEVIPGCVRGIVLASRYLIEPCGSGKSRILHLSRVDVKGRSSEWYNKCYGHICAQYLVRIRNSFQRMTEGPESKV